MAFRIGGKFDTTYTSGPSSSVFFTLPSLSAPVRITGSLYRASGDVASTLTVGANGFTVMTSGRALEVFNTTVSGSGGSNHPIFNRNADFTDITFDVTFVKSGGLGWHLMYKACGYDANANTNSTVRSGVSVLEPNVLTLNDVYFAAAPFSGQSTPDGWELRIREV